MYQKNIRHFGNFLSLLLVFPVIGLRNLYSCQAEQNFTRSPASLFTLRQQQRQQQQLENPASTLPINHSWRDVSGGLQKQVPLDSFAEFQPSSTSDRVADSISYSVLRFGLEVATQLSENAYYSKSEVFSPLSIMSALSFLLAGAKGNSYQQLKPIFGFDLNNDLTRDSNYGKLLHSEFGDLLRDIELGDLNALHHRNIAKWRDTPAHYNIRGGTDPSRPIEHVIKVANGIFAQTGYSLNQIYRDVVTSIYNAEFSPLDFRSYSEAARQHINAWVAKKTNGRIQNVINSAIPQTTNMILASVLYFKAFWENTFFESATVLDNFYPEGENKPPIRVQMMATGGIFPYYESPELNCRIIGLPYRGNLTTMYVIQPKQSSRASLKQFQNKITAESIDDLISKMAFRTAVVAFPKMHIERQLNMKEILKQFGVTDIFSNGASDLSLIGSLTNQLNYNGLVRPLHSIAKEVAAPHLQFVDRFNEKPLFFSSRFGDVGNTTKVNGTMQDGGDPKKTVTSNSRRKRDLLSQLSPISLLEAARFDNKTPKSDLYVEDILHKVNFEVNEQGTEAAAVTLTYLRRSGTDVVFRAEAPFILLIRHDPSKLVLFYGIINEPEST